MGRSNAIVDTPELLLVYRDHPDSNQIVGNNSESLVDSSLGPVSIDDGCQEPHVDDEDDSFPNDRKSPYLPELLETYPHLAVLPVLLLEFLALALTRAVLPALLLKRFGSRTYIVMGMAECVRGILAFLACPIFGKLSDIWGRRPCLLITVMGTLAPVCSLAFWRVDMEEFIDDTSQNSIGMNETIEFETEPKVLEGVDAEGTWYPTFGATVGQYSAIHSLFSPHRIDVFVVLLALSGMFSSTFTLTFAYISDVVKDRNGRVAAYGLALATFGLSFTIGPLMGGYLAYVDIEGDEKSGRNWMSVFHFDNENDKEGHADNNASTRITNTLSRSLDIHPIGEHRVFSTALVLAILTLLYIYFILPESLNKLSEEVENSLDLLDISTDHENDIDSFDRLSSTAVAATSSESNAPLPAGIGVSRQASARFWNPFDSIRYLTLDPLLSIIGRVTFLYYTALHAVVSTLILYAARQFHLGPNILGELMAALGLSTMLSEAVLVRIAIPALGEKRSMRVGLVFFSFQCVLLAVASRPWHLFLCAALSIPGNLVYPSVSSLVSATVRPAMVGRALGAVNGVKSLTEGVGPLVFGALLTNSEKDALPGWPYFIAAVMAALAFYAGSALPGDDPAYHSTELHHKIGRDRRKYVLVRQDND